MIIIGGAAAALAYQAKLTTTDIDTISEITGLEEAVRAAQQQTGLKVTISRTAVYEPPEDYVSRLQPLEIEGLQTIRLCVPDRYDLVLMKAMRCREHDLAHIEQVHRYHPLSLDELVARFKTMLPLGPAERSRGNLLVVAGRLFGDDVAEALEASLDDAGRNRKKDPPV